MPTTSLSIGTTAEFVCSPEEDDENSYLDVLIFNNSANIVYVLSDKAGDTTTGIPIPANGGIYSNPHRAEPIILIASGATSDVRVHYIAIHDDTVRKD